MVEKETPSSEPAPRRSRYINRKPAANLLHAVNVAECLGRPLNTMVTFNFAHTACAAETESRKFELLRDNYFVPWLRRVRKGVAPSGPPTYIWVMENANGCPNAHWLLHIPKERLADLQAKLPQWLAAVTGTVYDDQAIDVRAAPKPKGAAKYMTKGIDPLYAPLYRINWSDQGEIVGNRSNFSKCLRPSVRKHLQQTGQMPPTRRIGLSSHAVRLSGATA